MNYSRLRKYSILFIAAVSILYASSKVYPGLDGMTGMTAGIAGETPSSEGSDAQGAEAVVESGKNPIVLFCPEDNCGTNLEYLINNSRKADCAFFDLDLDNVVSALEMRGDNARVVVDADNHDESWEENFRKDDRSAYMHNKFCVFDSSMVWTGSMNPTRNGDERNNNNAVIIFSENIASNYEDEFMELWKGEFGSGPRTARPETRINSISIETYFCPEDYCANRVMEELDKADESIYFMTFSFTHDKIGDLLVRKQDSGVEVKGVFEKRQNSRYSEYKKLSSAGLEVRFDGNPYMMHHKTFIIDNRTVITGSFNPTMSGDTRNDENIVIITDRGIAQEFTGEFNGIYNRAGSD
ncbi:MAG: phospholipase D-like domain-containing protein [Candidatus Woesearchaeota archaeon]